MLAVATVGMLIYAVAGASPDGRELAPATCSSNQAGPPAPGCFETAAEKGSAPTTEKDGKGSTPTTTKCEPTTNTTEKGGGKGSTTTTTEKDGKGSTTSTTETGGKGSTTSTTETGGKGSTTSTTENGGKGATTATTAKDDSAKDDSAKDDSGSQTASKAAAPSRAMAVKGDAGATAAKDSGGDTASKAADTSGKDDKAGCGSTTTTTEKDGKGDGGSGGKGSTTTTTRKGSGGKGGKGSTTTTTTQDGKGDGGSGGKGSTTSTTTQGGGVDPQTPSDPGSGGGSDPGASPDPGDTPIEPQEAPPYDAPDSDPGTAEDPEAAADPGPVDSFDMWDDADEVAISPMEAPGSGEMMPVFNDFIPSPAQTASVGRTRSRQTRSSVDSTYELAAPPVVSLSPSSPAVTESAAVSRRLAGLQTSVTESAFPANIISTPGEFPVNRRDPLTAAALVILVGVSRELFKVWRRRATDFWPA